MRFFSFFALILIVACTACNNQRAITNNYLQKVDTSGINLLNVTQPRIQKNDLLSIKVYSLSADPRTDLPYNLPEQPTTTGTIATTSANGFLVDDAGNIEYPRLGTLHVEGLTKNELARQIKSKLDTALKSPSVIVRFLNYRVTVLGEVRTPGNFTIPTERITLLEALGMAGDITDFGSKDSVKILRENNGQSEIGFVNLTSKDFLNSPYYRLQQNDVIFVQQTRRKMQQQEQQTVAQQVGIAASIITAVALIINIIR